jgi:hypothetical protein
MPALYENLVSETGIHRGFAFHKCSLPKEGAVPNQILLLH